MLCLFWTVFSNFWKLLPWRFWPILTFGEECKETVALSPKYLLVVFLAVNFGSRMIWAKSFNNLLSQICATIVPGSEGMDANPTFQNIVVHRTRVWQQWYSWKRTIFSPRRVGGKNCENEQKKRTKNWAFSDVKRTFLNTEIQKGKHSLISPMWKYETIYFRYQTRTELSNPILLQHYKNHPFTTV